MSREISKLSVWMQEKAKEFIEECQKENLSVFVICTDRSNEEQAKCYLAGSTHAKPGQSAHNVCDINGDPSAEAFDIGVIRNGKYIGDGLDKDYQRAGVIGESIGLMWAGRWMRMKEVAHFQNPSFGKDV